MNTPVQITFRNMDASEALEARIREKSAKLEQVHTRITRCQVVVESEHRNHGKGKLYHVRIDVTVPDAELVVSHQGAHDRAHEDPFVAVRDAFDAMRRQLEAQGARQRGEVKQHAAEPA